MKKLLDAGLRLILESEIEDNHLGFRKGRGGDDKSDKLWRRREHLKGCSIRI